MSRTEIVKILKNGGIGVMPTDTIYGLVGSAFLKRAVERIYKVRKRDKKKPFIILISSVEDLKRFHITSSIKHLTIFKKIWPGPVSVIMPLPIGRQAVRKFRYLHRGTKTLAFRVPNNKKLRVFLKRTGPLIAPSANISGKPPAKTITEARKYFGERVDFYVNGGKITGSPSMILEIKR